MVKKARGKKKKKNKGTHAMIGQANWWHTQWGEWHMLAQDRPLWMRLSENFIKFCSAR